MDRADALAVVLGGMLAAGTACGADGCVARSGAQRTPLVELYTSEGCSSCPPADRWLSQQVAAGTPNYLAFHVDYWDDLGWPDRYALPVASIRQRRRVGAAGESTVYTPQVMVGSAVQVAWRNPAAWQRALAAAGGPAQARIELQRADTARIAAVAAIGADIVDARLWIAGYVDAQSSEIRAGENEGRTLRHDRVVRALHGPYAVGRAPETVSIDLPATPLSGVVAFIETPAGDVLQSLGLVFASCGDADAGSR